MEGECARSDGETILISLKLSHLISPEADLKKNMEQQVEGYICAVVAIYSTFLQRGYDGIVHDVALQNLPVVFGMDRAGLAGADGPTHHGTFDINYMLSVPGMAVTAPKDGSEMLALLRLGVNRADGPLSIRWPRDSVPETVPHISEIPEIEFGSWEILRQGSDVAILAVGTMVLEASKAAEKLAEEGIDATVGNCRFMKPYDLPLLSRILTTHSRILTVEEGAVVNGFGAFLSREAAGLPEGFGVQIRTLGIPDEFVAHGSRAGLLREIDLDVQGIMEWVRDLAGPVKETPAESLIESAAKETA